MPSKLKDAFRAHPDPVQHKLLDFASFQELPDSYKWTQLDRSSSAGESLPVIDLMDPNAFTNIEHACKYWGALQIINHGVPTTLLDNLEDATKSLFSLPVHQKLKAQRPADGVSGFGKAKISSFFSKLMWYEGFTIVGSPLEHFRQLWPQDYAKFCNIIEEYQAEMQKLVGKLMPLMLGSLGITEEDIPWAGPESDVKEASAALQLNYYPACPNPDQAMGLAAHTDSTLLTILYQNSTSGLEIFKEGTGWVEVLPIPGGLVINIGDLLHILSNGSYPSVLHRAMVNRSKHRLSMAYLYGPPSNVTISPLSKLIGPTQPPLYRAVNWNEYLGLKAKLFNEALPSIRVGASLNESIDGNKHHDIVKLG